MSDFKVGDIVYMKRDKAKAAFFVVEGFVQMRVRLFTWGAKRRFKTEPGILIGPCNARTLTRVPGRKAQPVSPENIQRLHLLEVMARVS